MESTLDDELILNVVWNSWKQITFFARKPDFVRLYPTGKEDVFSPMFDKRVVSGVRLTLG